MQGFTDRLEKAEIPNHEFVCVVVNQAPCTEDCTLPLVEAAIKPAQGLWERIDDHFMAIALWNKADLERLLDTIKATLGSAAGIDPIAGIAVYPFMAFSKQETFHNAVKAVDHAAFLGPGSRVCFGDVSLNISGDRRYELGFMDEAAVEYKKGIAINPDNINLLNSLGVCHGMNHDPEQAKKLFATALAKDPSEVMVVYNMGLACNILEQTKEALAYLEQASHLDNSIFEVELTAGNLLLKAGRLDASLEHLSRAKHLNARAGLPYRLLGEYFLATQKVDRAIAEFKQAVKLNPMDAVSLSGLAQAFYLKKTNLKIAITLARESIRIDPATPLYRSRLGNLYLQTGQEDLARSAFDLAEKQTAVDTSLPQKKQDKRSA
jgi:tetratricopeptide (TPR) repeat protein